MKFIAIGEQNRGMIATVYIEDIFVSSKKINVSLWKKITIKWSTLKLAL